MSTGPTRAALEQRIAELTDERDQWRACGPQDPEAMAIARCIVALDKIKPSSSYSGSGGYSTSSIPPQPSIGRVLDYLAKRYGVTT